MTEAIEEERKKADKAREERTMDMAVDLDDKIDAMIGGFMDEVGGGGGGEGKAGVKWQQHEDLIGSEVKKTHTAYLND